MGTVFLIFTLCGSPYLGEAIDFERGEMVQFLWEEKGNLPVEDVQFIMKALTGPARYKIPIPGTCA